MNGLLGLTNRYGPIGGNASGYSHRGLQKIRSFNDALDNSPCFRLHGGKGKARKDKLLRPALTNSPSQVLGTTHSRHYSERNLGQGKARMGGGVDEIQSR